MIQTFTVANKFNKNCRRLKHKDDIVIAREELNSKFTKEFVENFPTYVRPGRKIKISLNGFEDADLLIKTMTTELEKFDYIVDQKDPKSNHHLKLTNTQRKFLNCQATGSLIYQSDLLDSTSSYSIPKNKSSSCSKLLSKIIRKYLPRNK